MQKMYSLLPHCDTLRGSCHRHQLSNRFEIIATMYRDSFKWNNSIRLPLAYLLSLKDRRKIRFYGMGRSLFIRTRFSRINDKKNTSKILFNNVFPILFFFEILHKSLSCTKFIWTSVIDRAGTSHVPIFC